MRNKSFVLLLIFLTIILIGSGCSEPKNNVKEIIQQEDEGKDPANQDTTVNETQKNPILIKDTMVVNGDGWIYYCDFANRISRVKVDGSEHKTLVEHNEVRTGDIIVHNNWIYFANWEDDGKVYRIKTDGSELVKLSEDESCLYLNVENEWVYYQPQKHGMTRVKTDGSYQERIIKNNANHLQVNDGWIYYQQTADDQDRVENKMYKVRVDGTGRIKLDDAKSGYHVIDGEWIYYKEWIPPTSDRYEIGGAKADFYRIKTNGNEKQQLSEYEAKYVTVYNNLIYYANLSDGVKLYRMKTNGEDKMKLIDEQANFINVVDDWIYFAGANNQLCRIRIDGTKKELILN